MSNLLEASLPKNARTFGQFPAELPAVKGDPTQLRQLAMNLIMNAADSLPDGAGTIRLATGLADLSSEKLSRLISGAGLAAGRYVYIEVCDTGCGMTEEVKSKLFDPFFSTKGQGRGLGLAAVLGIVRGHQGALQVDSESGSGTVVRVFLPASERTVTLQPSAPHKNRIGQTGPATILVVDDVPAVLDSARLLLESMGFSVLTAGDGLEAVDIFRTRSAEIGAVLLDLSMPAMPGADVFRELRSLRPDAPILLTSGYSEEEAVQAFQEKGLAGFIQKPYRTEDLRAKLSAVLQREPSAAKPV
jgi:CheY-like chemotaxis protein